jgi:hypothetical protein
MRILIRAGLILFLAAGQILARTVQQLHLRGDSRILSLDMPVRKGSVLLFHRYPDGVLLSVPAADVLGVSKTEIPTNVEGLRVSETILLGPTGEGQRTEAAPPEIPQEPTTFLDLGYADYGYGYGCCSGPHPPRPGPLPPALVGPNGYPMAPGTKPLPIGPNGFPILAPTPPPR